MSDIFLPEGYVSIALGTRLPLGTRATSDCWLPAMTTEPRHSVSLEYRQHPTKMNCKHGLALPALMGYCIPRRVLLNHTRSSCHNALPSPTYSILSYCVSCISSYYGCFVSFIVSCESLSFAHFLLRTCVP